MTPLRSMIAIPAMAALLAVSGCNTLADAKAGRGGGEKRAYHAGYDRTWDAAVASIGSLGLPLVNSDKASGQILAQRGISAFSYGENVAIFVDKKDADNTEVEVVSKKAMSTNIFAPDWSGDILDRIDATLKN